MAEGWDELKQAANGAANPAPDPVSLATKRMRELSGQVSDAVVSELGRLRDNLDDLIKTIQQRDATLVQAFEEHATFSINAMKAKNIIEETIVSMTKDFQNGTPPLEKTLTISQNK